jgi:hypothetical protein
VYRVSTPEDRRTPGCAAWGRAPGRGARIRHATTYHAGMTAQFRTLALVVPMLRARTGLFGRAERVMSAEEVAAHVAILRTMPSAVAAWSEGNAVLDPFEVRVLDDVVMDRLDRYSTGWWPSPDSQEELLASHVRAGRLDSVILVWPGDAGLGGGAWGLTRGPNAAAGGAGYSAITSGSWPTYATATDPAHGFVHEWLHQVEAIYHDLGLGRDALPDLHDVDGRATTRRPDPDGGRSYVEWERATGSWRPWYRDYLTGTVGPNPREGEGIRGLTPERWARRRNPIA